MENRGILKRIRLAVCLLLTVLLAAGSGLSAVYAATNDHKIQQLYVNKPDVTVYYRDSAADRKLEAYLDGEKLEHVKDTVFSETGMAVEHYLLVDISGSISDFDKIREAIIAFRKSLRKGDRMSLVSFGDKVTRVLDGSEDAAAAESAISALEANDSTTVLAEAVKETADMMEASADPDTKVQTLIIISDGKPDTDNNASIDNAQSTLVSKGIQAYTVAVDNKEGDSKETVNSYRSRFNDIASSTGGLSKTVDSADVSGSVQAGLQQAQKDMLASNVASFRSSSNKVSNKTEEFVLKFVTSGTKDSRKVLVEKHKSDQTAPEIESVKASGDKSIIVTFSEAGNGADRTGNYAVSADGKAVPVSQVKAGQDNSYTLVLGESFRNADYEITVSGITDTSEEANEVSGGGAVLTIDNIAPEVTSVKKNNNENGFIISYSEPVEGADDPANYKVMLDGEEQDISKIAGSGDTDSGSYELILKKHLKNAEYKVYFENITDAKTGKNELAETEKTVKLTNVTELTTAELVLEFLRDWWPFVLTAVVLILILLIVRFVKRVKSNKYTIVEGQMVETDNVEEKFHVGVGQVQTGTPIVMWLSNGRDEPKRVERTLNGSMCIGRSPNVCDVYCDDPMMSKQHFILSKEDDGYYYVTDLDSKNGTIVNGVRITEKRRITPQDEISAGNIRFHFEW